MIPTSGVKTIPIAYIPNPSTEEAIPACLPCLSIAIVVTTAFTNPNVDTTNNNPSRANHK